MKHDIIIIGAGPAGLSFARSLANTSLNILIIEKSPLSLISDPEPDGREIALTHLSVKLMKNLGAWSRIPTEEVTLIKQAKVVNGDSSYSLDFDTQQARVTALGYMVSNHLIRKSLYDEVAIQNNIDIICDAGLEKIKINKQDALISLSNGDSYSTKLVVAADSRFSETRRKMGIAAKMRDFSKVAIVCRMEHEKSHNDIATECFHYGRTLAILPLRGKTSSIVITASTAKAEDIVNMDEASFNKDIQERFGNQLGTMQLIGKRYPYPLVAVHADKFVSHRFALIGDAAVGMHPVTAHGFNLGLRGQDYLADEIKKSLAENRDIATLDGLKNYESKHMRYTWPMYLGTNGIVKLFTNDSAPARVIRGAVLRLANKLPPVKQLIAHSLTEKETAQGIRKFLPL